MQGHFPLEYWLEISCILTFLLPVLMLNCNDYDGLQIVISSMAVLHMTTKYIKMIKIVEGSFMFTDKDVYHTRHVRAICVATYFSTLKYITTGLYVFLEESHSGILMI